MSVSSKSDWREVKKHPSALSATPTCPTVEQTTTCELTAMADVSDPKIQEAYDQVRLDKSDTTVGFVLLRQSKCSCLQV